MQDVGAEAIQGRMRAAVAEAVAGGAARLRAMSAPALMGVLAVAALAPVIVASGGGAAVLLTAGAGVLGSLGTNVLTDLVTSTIARLRAGGAEPSSGQVQQAVAQRIEAAFASGGAADQELRSEVIGLFKAVDVTGAALQAAATADGQHLMPRMVTAFGELAAMFGEFALVLSTSRVGLEALHQDVRREIARQSVDRERARQAEGDIGRILDLLREPRPPAPAARDASPRWDGCPYLGLLPFEERHAAVFYGRRELTSRLMRRLAAQLTGTGMVLVLGPSGAGKSSLLRAGLMTGLAADGLVYGCRSWPRRVLTPTMHPLLALATHLADLAGLDAVSVHQALSDHPEQAHLLAAQIVAAHRPAAAAWSPRLVLVVDQLEELFTLVDDATVRDRFLTALQAMAVNPALADGQPAALIVAGIRGDFLDQAVLCAPIRAAVEASPFTVGPMSESELREAITGPAAEAGVRVPDELATAILDDLRDRDLTTGFDSGALPLLSQAMFVLWQTGDGLTVAGYRRTGGVATIVHTSAERVYHALTERQRELARHAFICLTGTHDGRLTRRPASLDTLRSATGHDAELEVVLEAFTAQRLVTRTDRGTVAIAHEELLNSWTRLRDWLQPNLTDQALHRALIEDAQSWHAHDRNPDYLYRGSRLVAVRDAAPRWGVALDPTATEFLARSHRRDQRRRRLTRGTAIALAALLVLSLAAAAVAFQQRQAALDAQRVALSRQLAAQSLSLSNANPELAALLALHAYRLSPTREARSSLYASAPATHALLRSFSAHTDNVRSVAFTPDGRTLATGGWDDTARLWDVATGTTRATLSGHTDNVLAVAFTPDGSTLATGSADHTVRLWDVATGKLRTTLTDHTDAVNAVAFSPDGRTLATGSADRTARLWDVATGKVRTTLTGHTDVVLAVAFSPDGRTLATGGGDDSVRLWDVATGTTRTLSGHTDYVMAVAFSPDGRTLATGSADRTARLWDVATGTVKTTIGNPTGTLISVAFSPDGRTLATGSNDYAVRLWDVATGATLTTLIGHTGAVTSVRFSPDGRTLATGSADDTARLWRMTGVRVLAGHADRVVAVAFSPDGRTLATGSYDHTARLLDVATRTAVATLTGHDAIVWSVAFSPDGYLLATGSDDRTVRLWDVATGTAVTTLTGHISGVGAVAFSPDGRTLATGSEDATVRLWPVAAPDVAATIADICSVVGRDLTPQEFAQYLPGQPAARACRAR